MIAKAIPVLTRYEVESLEQSGLGVFKAIVLRGQFFRRFNGTLITNKFILIILIINPIATVVGPKTTIRRDYWVLPSSLLHSVVLLTLKVSF